MMWLVKLKNRIDGTKEREAIYLLPLLLFCMLCFYQSLTFSIHDYSVGYFPARMLTEGIAPEEMVFDIYDYNQYIWDTTYTDEVSDFYLNSPFLSTLLYPFGLIKNPHLSKACFNILSIILFLMALRCLARRILKENTFVLIFLPVLFFFPIRNHILFGQLYMLIFGLISFGFLAYERNSNLLGGGLLSIAVLSKVFPVFYLLALVFKRQWKSVLVTTGVGAVIFLLSLWVSGFSFWYEYLFDVLPGALASESTTDFRSNAQSLDVFFRTLMIRDDYYNPDAFLHNPALYKLIVGALKAVILAFTLRASCTYRNDIFKLLAIWVAALFLLQTRTGSYAQVLWIIPLIALFKSPTLLKERLPFLGILLVICNFPYPILISAPILITFARLWLSILLIWLFWKYLGVRINLKYLGLALLVTMPLALKSAFSDTVSEDGSSYVLKEKEHFLVYDFEEVDGYLSYEAIGRDRVVKVNTRIPISSFDSTSCSIRNGQVFYMDQRLTEGASLNKKPVLVNGCEVYYLSDRLSRRGAYTLKKINVCGELTD